MNLIRATLVATVTVFLVTCYGCKKDFQPLQQARKLNSNTAYRLNNIKFVSDSECIAAGGSLFDQAVIVRSTDGGYTWAATEYPDAGKAMLGMGEGYGGRLYLCGVDGTILHTADRGASWQLSRIWNWQHYVGGMFPTRDTGVFISTVLQRQCSIVQVDTAFNVIDEKTMQHGVNNIYMLSPSTGYIIGYGAVLKTTDHRRTWVYQDVKGDNFTAMDIHGDEIWMCGANGGIYHTADGGNSWRRLRNGNNVALPRYYLRSIAFKDRQHGWAVGDDGVVIYTDDAGAHWKQYDKFTTDNLRSIALCPNGEVLIAGDNGGIYRITP